MLELFRHAIKRHGRLKGIMYMVTGLLLYPIAIIFDKLYWDRK